MLAQADGEDIGRESQRIHPPRPEGKGKPGGVQREKVGGKEQENGEKAEVLAQGAILTTILSLVTVTVNTMFLN